MAEGRLNEDLKALEGFGGGQVPAPMPSGAMPIPAPPPDWTAGPEFFEAFAEAQAAMQNARENKTNPHFKNDYADLAAIRDATLPALTENGLSIVQFTWISPGGFFLRTRVCHKSGQFIESVYPLPMITDKPQALGSALTYAKRYSWAAICGISAEADDDAEGAEGPTISKTQQAELLKLCADREIDPADWLKAHGLTVMADIRASKFQAAKTALVTANAKKGGKA